MCVCVYRVSAVRIYHSISSISDLKLCDFFYVIVYPMVGKYSPSLRLLNELFT